MDVKSAKIIAGLEAPKTNKLLNDLAKAITDKKPFLQAVDSVRKGLKPPGSSSSTPPTTQAGPVPKKAPANAATTKAPASKSNAPATRSNVTKPAAKTTQNKTVPKPKTPETKKIEESVVKVETNENIERPKTQEIIKEKSKLEPEKEETESDAHVSESIELEPEPEFAEPDPEPEPEVAPPTEQPNSIIDSIPFQEETKQEIETIVEEEKSSRRGTANKKAPSAKPAVIQREKSTEEVPKVQNGIGDKVSKAPESRKKSSRQRSSRPAAPPPPVQTMESVEKTALPMRSARPGSSRPAPPRVMTASRNRLQHMLDSRTSLGRGGASPSPGTIAPQIWPPPEGLALELNLDNDDDDGTGDDFTMSTQKLQDTIFSSQTTEQTLQNDMFSMNDNGSGVGGVGGDASKEKGKLMQQLLANKNELEGTLQRASLAMENSSTSSATDTEQLRAFVRELCQSVATLTKAVNYLHEDVDPMVAELSQWRTEYRQNLTQIEELRTETERQLEPLRIELEKVDKEVQEFKDKLYTARSNVYRNSTNISKIIQSI